MADDCEECVMRTSLDNADICRRCKAFYEEILKDQLGEE